jgi:hypothetical protein
VKRLLAAVTVSAAAVLSLAACGGGDDPLEPAAKNEESSTPTPTKAADVALEVPEAARAKTTEGAIEFTKFYFAQVNEAFATGEYLPLVKITSSSCIVCRQTIGDIAFAWARGSIKGGAFTLKDVTSVKESGDLHSLSFSYDEEAYSELDHKGSTVWEAEAKKGLPTVVQIKWVDGAWQMAQLAPNTKVKDADK